MIFIDLSKVEAHISPDWLTKAKNATEQARAIQSSAERTRFINQNAAIWSELKDLLMDCSEKKCWYCETKRRRDYYTVDHFRPKSSVDENKEHSGYWWLAFEWRNLRFSCSYCNSGYRKDGVEGKKSSFPIVDETKRAAIGPNATAEIDSCIDESPVLLDPTRPLDVQLLDYMPDGTVGSWYESDENIPIPGHRYGHTRATASIRLLGLNGTTLVDERKLLLNEIRRLVNLIDFNLNRTTDDPALVSENTNALLQQLCESISFKGEYSAAARRYVSLLSESRSWLRRMLECC